ncbi:MAG: rnfA: electron transport complex, RnfABCDGE type, subunit [Haloplasmataceae bacterium]|jgi:electron transport complex protein RnfA|nr:rnfA: electron transport complex, RnfABCDGE type, subunit [Haloplasmataceae bacterium]
MNLIILGISSILIQNVILSQFLGICSYIGVSKKSQSAIGMGLAVIFVILTSSLLTFTIDKFILYPNDLIYMRTIVYILVISGVVQFVEMFIKKAAPLIYKMLGIYLPLITTNCAVLGVALTVVAPENKNWGYPEVIVYSLGISIGYTLIIYVFSTMRERLENSDIPEAFKGTPIAFITTGIMAIAFMGFAGLLG